MTTLAEWMDETGTTPEAVAKAIGRDPSTVRELRAGRRWPSGTTALALHELSGGRITRFDVAVFARERRIQVPRRNLESTTG